ncbi:MAG: hypothetical protein R3C02_09340 [Planctomycetaceae bacterium]
MLLPHLSELEALRTRILIPVHLRRNEHPCNHINPPVTVHVIRKVAIRFDVSVPVIDLPHWPRDPLPIPKPVPPRNNIQLAIIVHVRNVTPLVGINGEQLDGERQR